VASPGGAGDEGAARDALQEPGVALLGPAALAGEVFPGADGGEFPEHVGGVGDAPAGCERSLV